MKTDYLRHSTLRPAMARWPVVRAEAREGAWVPNILYALTAVAWRVAGLLFVFGIVTGGFGWVIPRGVHVPSRSVVDRATAGELLAGKVMLTSPNGVPLIDPRHDRISLVRLTESGLSGRGFATVADASWPGATALIFSPDANLTAQQVIDGLEEGIAAAQTTGTHTIRTWLIDLETREGADSLSRETRRNTGGRDTPSDPGA